jgi:hypothetical protein
MKKTNKMPGMQRIWLCAAAIIAAIALNALSLTGCSMLPEADLAVVSIEITKPTKNTTYNLGDPLKLDDMEVTATFEDGTKKVVKDYTTSFDSTSPGTKTVTVTYKGKTDTFTITVNPSTPTNTKTLSSIAVTPPSKTTYAINEQLNTAGMVVTATYSDNSTETVASGFTTSTLDSATAGEKTITVTYQSKTATFNVTVRVAIPATTYAILGSGTAFTATKGEQTIGTANQPIQTVIDGIRSNAAGQAAAIYFGDGVTALDTGTASVSFNNTGSAWGAVTLSGKITSSNATNTIYIGTGVSVSSGADITNTSTGDAVINEGTLSITTGTVQSPAFAVRNGNSTVGTLTISGGTVKTTGSSSSAVQNNNSNVTIQGGTVSASGYAWAIYNVDAGTVNITGGTVLVSGAGAAVYNKDATGLMINISGGTVQSTTGKAVDNGAGKVTISGTAKVTSAGTSSTISLRSGATAGTVVLEIKGGTVENTNTSTTAKTINNEGNGTVTISGGTVSATAGRAVDNYSTGIINITGGKVEAGAGRAVNNGSTGQINISGGEVKANTGIAVNNVSTGKITISGSATKITSQNTSNNQGTITLESGNTSNTNVRLEITSGTVENTAPPQVSNRYAIYNISNIQSMVSISSSGVTITGLKYGTP